MDSYTRHEQDNHENDGLRPFPRCSSYEGTKSLQIRGNQYFRTAPDRRAGASFLGGTVIASWVTMMTIMFVMLGLAGIGLLVAATAPVGYQDENGFHFGQKGGASATSSSAEIQVDFSAVRLPSGEKFVCP